MQTKQKVSVIGQGYVGIPISIAISNSKKVKFRVFGVEKDNKAGQKLAQQINNGELPIKSEDKKIYKKFVNTRVKKNFSVTTDLNVIKNSNIIIISINFDFKIKNINSFKVLKKFFARIGSLIKKNTLIIVETTLPPGTTDKIIYPAILNETSKRGIKKDDVLLSYSYERVMPGEGYYDSVTNNFRVFSGINKKSKIRCKNFLSKIINIKKYPLTKLDSNTECEFSKILENSYRATNIAFIDEWTKYSKIADVNLYNVLAAIKKRDTHKNIMRPGLGVGGYCLTKDPTFAITSAKNIFNKKTDFPFVKLTMKTNKNMPNTSIEYIKKIIKNYKSKKILILGMSYREGIADFRDSPSIFLYNKLKKLGAKVEANDPNWFHGQEKNFKKIIRQKNKLGYYDILIFCTPHKIYNKINLKNLSKSQIIIDLNNVISGKNFKNLSRKKMKIYTLGKN